ncbi:NMCC_0638 family (lipo)protein [Sphingomonas phyllosphaerae]|uniref:NMCC_0638 family (lipo)protein n=1 Tax=Sphingomonas phyllosphaerae TaxID=257003 RepID=UPI00041C6003|nr:hypothetical protein [Sphingomonas phyllosphaerae]
MIAAMLLFALQAAPPQQLPGKPPFRGEGQMRMFDMICGRIFPDDARVAAGMARIPGARPLTPEQLRTYLKDDPGRGWIMPAGASQIVVTIEAPPIHSCTVRINNTDGAIDEGKWQQMLTAAQARSGGGFVTLPPQTFETGGVRSQVGGVQKQGAGGAAEAIYLIRSTPKQPGFATEIRMVRQLVTPQRR